MQVMARQEKASRLTLAETISWWASAFLLALMLILSCYCGGLSSGGGGGDSVGLEWPCEEIYVVGEGVTMIGKFGEPYVFLRIIHMFMILMKFSTVCLPGFIIAYHLW
ncbi:hypothetical protein Salat_1017000 [Sesamum alatum]|uniref:Uncharacterized protein n=1 Tax=Sesamum alatum TaxID=300844 RepID=A0AAE1YMC4_9LAMI|nr:hypothetical protein Salat_1017000 [Sesamum alatum]